MTVEERLVRQARLWDTEAVARQAREWLKGDGAFFRELKGSQVNGLAGEVWKAGKAYCFIKRTATFMRGCAKRGNKWAIANGRFLRLGMYAALRRAREQNADENKAFRLAVTALPEDVQRETGRARDLEILREYFSAIVRAHQAIQEERRSGIKWTDFSN